MRGKLSDVIHPCQFAKVFRPLTSRGDDMDRKSTKNLHLDQRLVNRKNWISSADLEKELSALPDVSHKIADPEEKPESSQGTEEGLESEGTTSSGSELPHSSLTGV